MTDTLFTIQEQNEYDDYDKLYPKTHASLIVNPPQATGARIDVLCLPASSGITVNLSGQKTASATTDSDGKCSFEGLDYGEYTVSATVGGSEKSETVSIDTSKIYDVTLGISKTLEDNDWATISAISKAGLAESYWSVGDTKSVVLTGQVGNLVYNNYAVNAFILDFNHDKSDENSEPNGITFGTFENSEDSSWTEYAFTEGNYGTIGSTIPYWFLINTLAQNTGGWKSCEARYSLIGSTDTVEADASSTTATSPVEHTIMSLFSDDVRAVMKPMYIYTDNTGNQQDADLTGTIDYLPLLSEFEIWGKTTYSSTKESNLLKQYAYYTLGNSKKKYRVNKNNISAKWWCRSPCRVDKVQFCLVDLGSTNAPYAGISNPRYSYGIAPMFKV